MPDDRPSLLYLVHRIPFPPNKGDKVRSFNILRHLSLSHRIFLGTFIDSPDDRIHVSRLQEWCEEIIAFELNPFWRRLLSLHALFTGEPLSVPYYRDRRLASWVTEKVHSQAIQKAVAFSGPMAQYLTQLDLQCSVIDFCDVDSVKWTQYANGKPWPLSWLYRREGERLFAFERASAHKADCSLFVTAAESDLFCRMAPEVSNRVRVMQNGVDASFFSPDAPFECPYPAGGPNVLFTGAMDYWPNVDAVTWFAKEILPSVQSRIADVRFWIVGMNPAPAVAALAGDGITVTGTVPDVRPYLSHADVVVAPLRIARGIQNKVLEAMAMARPVILSAAPAVGLVARNGADCVVAEGTQAFADGVVQLLTRPQQWMGMAARECILKNYSWQAHLSLLDEIVADGAAAGRKDAALS